MTQETKGSKYSTNELSMAAFLSMNGFMFEVEKDGQSSKGHPIGKWVFTDRNELLGKHIQEFNNGEAKVEPHRFLNEVNRVRKVMFDYLGISPRRP